MNDFKLLQTARSAWPAQISASTLQRAIMAALIAAGGIAIGSAAPAHAKQRNVPAEAAPSQAAPTSPAANPAAAAAPASPVAPASQQPPAPTPAERAAAEAAAARLAEIEAAKAHCTTVLAKLDVVVIYKAPVEEGECGTLAPVELVSVGKSPQVALSPPAVVNCDMAAAIHDWIKIDVQPLAKKHLGYPVARMETMSSYSCRNAFGRKGGKLSEHGKANALDIRGFVSAKGQTAYLLEDWGLTGVEIAAIAAKADQERKAREFAEATAKADAAAKAQAQAGAGGKTPAAGANPLSAAQTIVEGLPKPNINIGGTGLGGPAKPSDFGIAPNRLGGPQTQVPIQAQLQAQLQAQTPAQKKTEAPGQARAKPQAPIQPPSQQLGQQPGQQPRGAQPQLGPVQPKPGLRRFGAVPIPPPAISPLGSPEAQKLALAKSAFLREVQTTACKRFMTTLGPESDKFHRNHFHIDLAERRTRMQICE